MKAPPCPKHIGYHVATYSQHEEGRAGVVRGFPHNGLLYQCEDGLKPWTGVYMELY